ncbi:hypothetical protein DDJ61_03195 [Mycobacteroides abscessus]|nr:hypothetical protein DDJ61_03195 [Mycobacteroides abscessus]
MRLADLLDEPQHLAAPNAEFCSAADRPEAWAALSVGWSRVLGAAQTIRGRHSDDSADAAREASVSELRWVWARLVNKYLGEVDSDV